VRINDISVSRTHALLTFNKNKIYIKDLKSKFGTLVLVQNEIEINDKIVSLQIGRTYGEFTVSNYKEYQKFKKE
jgi:pSer/pThr/pTyr-binding forkhead associated (FHA) protein